MNAQSKSAWVWLPLQEAIDGPKSGFCRIIPNNWWAHHSEKGLLFYKSLNSPQCNRDRSFTECIIATRNIEGLEVIFLPRVIICNNPQYR
jgi:hypothetical protein